MSANLLTVSDLFIYPVKSARAVGLEQADVVERGFAGDRRWMLIDSDGQFLTQRKHPLMATVNCQLLNTGLRITVPGLETLLINTPDDSSTVTSATVWKDQCQALDAGDAAAAWFSAFMGQECRLVYMPESTHRQVDLRFANEGDITGFADGFPFLLTNEASLKELNSRLVKPVTMQHFRPNIVIQGADAYAEDQWQRIRVGEVHFRVAKPCSRCVMTTVDPETGKRAGKDPLATLATYRRNEYGVIFGQNLIQESHGTIRKGDVVEVLE